MKKILLTISLLSIVPFVNSCSDAYNIEQAGEFSEAATFKTTDDMQLYLNEVYDRVNTAGEIEFTGLLTDETSLGSQNGGQNNGIYRFILNPTTQATGNTLAGIWGAHYQAINFANRLIRGAASITPTSTADQAKYNSILAQARAIRAFAHFQLLTFFAPDLKNDNGIGVILLTNVPESINETKPRNTVGEVFAQINIDLDFAEANLGTPVTTLGKYKYVSTNMINALRARMNAYRGKYADAETYADKVINGSGLTLTLATPVPSGTPGSTAWNSAYYSSTTTNPYRRMWADLDQGEIIFALDRSPGKGTIGNIYYFNQTNFSGGPFMEMGRNLFNILDNTSGDIRRRAYIDPTSKVDPNYLTNPNYKLDDVLCIDKYPGKPSGAPLNNDLKIFRLSEMYLIKAEARVAANDLVGAATQIKKIRDARNFIAPVALPVYANAQAGWKDILKERRVELAFEGHRYIDLKRLGTLAGEQIDRNSRDTENMNEKTMAPSDYRFTLPIPFEEMNANSTIQQNSGY
ncbi:RagB/SusD family nutrient uptake outer membrane protein [Chryseobacterium gleum]|uniref:RagB/SusD family nutrient uptake outer membrane protein n=1 Tax=Chryseobacterium gleum TaxID=250 RepID=UPI0031D15079